MWILENEKKQSLTDNYDSPKTYVCAIPKKFLPILEFAWNMGSWQKIYITSKRWITSEFISLAFRI